MATPTLQCGPQRALDASSSSCRRRSKSLASIARRDRAAGQHRGDRLHRRGDVVGLQPTGFVPWGALDRRQCEFYRAFAARPQDAFEANRIAVGSPTRASSTALRVNASDSRARNAAAASVALLREPVCRPGGIT